MPNEQYPKIYLYKRIVQAKLYIDRHYQQAIDLDNIAGEACFSKFHFTRLFKTVYGTTPHQYLTLQRVEKAKTLLQQNLSVATVCFAVGFSSVSTFTGLFKKTTGITRAAYQQLQLQRNNSIQQQPLQFVPACFAWKNGWL
jgi:AraC-like DNA-binding protein